MQRRGDDLQLDAAVEGDGYPGFARTELVLVLHGSAPVSVRHDDVDVAGTGGRYRVANGGTSFRLQWSAP